MAIGLGLNRGNVFTDGITSIKVSSLDTGTPTYYDMGKIKDGVLTIMPNKDTDSAGRNIGFGFTLKVEAKLMYTNVTNLIQVLNYMSLRYLNFIITTFSGITFSSHNLASGTTGVGFLGFKWTFDSSKDMNGIRYVQIELDRDLLLSDVDYLVATAPISGATADAVLALISTQTQSDMIPAGVVSYKLAPSTYVAFEDIGVIKNAKLQCELLTDKDWFQRSMGIGIKIHSEVEGQQTGQADLLLADNVTGIPVAHKITLLDGGVFKSINQQGIDWECHFDKGIGNPAFIKFAGDGIITNMNLGITSTGDMTEGQNSIVRTSGSYISDGWVVGMKGQIVQTGANNLKYFTVTGVAALTLTVSESLTILSPAVSAVLNQVSLWEYMWTAPS